MASVSETKDRDQTSFKCRRCRQFLFSSASILPSLIVETKPTRLGSPGSEAPASGREQPRTDGALWYISDDAVPPWIQSAIEEAQWTKGKLTCPKCKGRLGSFDFLTPSVRHRANRQQPWSCIQINSSRVDRDMPQSLLTQLRRGKQSQVKGHAQEKAESVTSNAGRFEDCALPTGCWYLNREEMDTIQSSLSLCPIESGQRDILDSGINTLGSFAELTKASILESTSNTSNSPHTPNACDSCPIGECSRVQANQAVSKMLPCYLQSSEKQLENCQARLKPCFGDLERTTNIPFMSHTNSVDETIQFGFSTAGPSRPSREINNVVMSDDCDTEIDAGITAEKSKSCQLLKTNLSNSFSQDYQGLYHTHPTRPVQYAPKRPIRTQYSNTDGQSEQTEEAASSPEAWQCFLDELLLDLDEERGWASARTKSGRDDFNQPEEERDTGRHHPGNLRTAQAGRHDNEQGISAYLHRAVQRAQRRESNKRKSARRKLRRRERWMAENRTEEQELLSEEQNLDCDPEMRLLNLLGTPEASSSTREALTCPVCLDLYLNPHRCLPCQHLFCEPCLRCLAHTVQTGVTTPCPLCRSVIREAQPQEKLRAAIEESFPRLIAIRKQAERKSLNKSYPLPGHIAPTSLTSWINLTLAGNNRSRLRHWRGRGRQEQTTVGLIINMAWKVGSVLVLMISMIVLSAGFFFAMIKYS